MKEDSVQSTTFSVLVYVYLQIINYVWSRLNNKDIYMQKNPRKLLSVDEEMAMATSNLHPRILNFESEEADFSDYYHEQTPTIVNTNPGKINH